LSHHYLLCLPNSQYAYNCSQMSIRVRLSNFHILLCSCHLSLPVRKSKEQGNYIHDGGISATRNFLSNYAFCGLERVVDNFILVNYFSTNRSSSSASNEKIFDCAAPDSANSKGISIMIAALVSFLLALELRFRVCRYRLLVYMSIYRRQDHVRVI